MPTAAEEKRRKRLEAWRKRQASAAAGGGGGGGATSTKSSTTLKPNSKLAAFALSASRSKPKPKPKTKPISLSLSTSTILQKKRKREMKTRLLESKRLNSLNLLDDDEEEEEEEDELGNNGKQKKSKGMELDAMMNQLEQQQNKGSSKWDTKKLNIPQPSPPTPALPSPSVVNDALDQFMEKLDSGALGNVVTQHEGSKYSMNINLSGTMQKSSSTNGTTTASNQISQQSSVSSSISQVVPNKKMTITPEELANLHSKSKSSNAKPENPAVFTASDWESDANTTNNNPNDASEQEDEDSDEDEEGRQSFIQALKNLPATNTSTNATTAPVMPSAQTILKSKLLNLAPQQFQLASEVKDEKQRREETLAKLQEEAKVARKTMEETPSIGRIFNDFDSGVMEEAERTLDVLNSEPDALQVLAELNKKKELKAVDHSKVDYMDIRKNLYIVPRSLANLTADDIADRRAKMKVKVRGVGCPAPITTFREGGLSERILSILSKQKIESPFPVQSQCIPAIMGGRDVIGIAKTGSGKTLAYLLPMLRHILDQPDLEPNESGPIGLVLAPARELAAQIHSVCKMFAKQLGIKSTAVYGGAGVADQIGDLKRGTHIAVATPGRMIDILTMQSGKILSLRRVSYVVMDEADRMFDMGFAPQISAILSAVRPDRQTVLFSATFPKVVENLARKSLKFPVEVIVGGRSVASDSVTQYGEVVEEGDKFLRLLQLLGENVDENQKVIVFVDTQVRADSVFQQLISFGYLSLSLHGGKEQEDRDSTISDFKRSDGPNVLVATSVAGRGLDVQSCSCVINYSSPNHLEDYVHRVGRTGRASKKGVSYTFVNSGDEAKFAPIVVRAMIEAGQGENISPELKTLSDSFKQKVKKGEARWAGSGFKGKGYSYDSSELNDSQKLAKLEKRQALIEAGLIDPEDEEDNMNDDENGKDDNPLTGDSAAMTEEKIGSESDLHKVVDLSTKLSANVLALPGMQEAILKKVGVVKEDGLESSGNNPNHFVEEIEINDYPREARWKVTQKETTSRLQDEFQTAVTLKGEYFGPGRAPNTAEGERKLYLHLEATTSRILKNCVLEIRRLLNEETLRVGARGLGGGHRYSVL